MKSILCIVTVLSLMVVSDAMAPKLPKFLEKLFIRLCNRPEIIEKICPDQDPCDGVTCSGNGGCVEGTGMCNCDANFTGGDCQFCTVFTTPRAERDFSLEQFEVTGPVVSDATECTAQCTSDMMCSTSIFFNNECKYYSDSVITATAASTIDECINGCIFTENCISVAFIFQRPCLLLRIPQSSIIQGTGDGFGASAAENCNA